MIDLLEQLHGAGYVHNDVKLENFVLGLGKKSRRLHLIDLGFSMRYIDKKTNQIFDKDVDNKKQLTPVFASLNAHKGYTRGRADDLESLGYVLINVLYPKFILDQIDLDGDVYL